MLDEAKAALEKEQQQLLRSANTTGLGPNADLGSGSMDGMELSFTPTATPTATPKRALDTAAETPIEVDGDGDSAVSHSPSKSEAEAAVEAFLEDPPNGVHPAFSDEEAAAAAAAHDATM
jgi:hypothetical protein